MTHKPQHLPVKRLWPVLIVFVLVSCNFSINHNFEFDSQNIDHVRAREILRRINTHHRWGEGPPLPINYFQNYAILRNTPEWNCVDFAFAFAGLYGWPAQVAMSVTHAFVVIGPHIIEPNNPNWDRHMNVTEHRLVMDNKEYQRIRTIDRIFDSDIQIIINHFRTRN